MKKTALILICFNVFYCLKASSSPTATTPLPAIDNLVVFEPEITIGSSQCQGVRVSDDLIATAPKCALNIRELSDYKPIGIYTAQGESLGNISDNIQSDDPQKKMLLRLDPNKEFTEGNYPNLYRATSVPEQAFVYSVDDHGQIAQQPVILSFSDELGGSSFYVSSIESFLPGSPVFDTQGFIVCILTGDNQCQTLQGLQLIRAKREVADYEDYPDDYDGLSVAEEAGITVGVIGALLSATATGLFFLTTYMQAKRAGMPFDVFWSGVLTFRYLSYCDTSSAIMALIGVVVLPCFLCPLAANHAATSWIHDYARTHSEHAPILQQPHAQVVPQY